MAAEPSNIKQVEYNGDKLEVVEMSYIPEYDGVEYNLDDDKEFENYLKKVEKMCRNSFEYKEYIKYLREYMDMNKCSFFENVNNIDTTKIKIHIHHSPITLYEIVITVYNKRQYYGECLDVESVATEAMYLHYCLLVGLIPLCETIHTLVHNEYIFIPNSAVMGKYNEFVKIYDPWIPWQVKEKLNRIEEFSNIFDQNEYKAILEPHYIYLDFGGLYKLPKTEDILEILSQRMNLLKENNYSLEQPTNNNRKPFIKWVNN